MFFPGQIFLPIITIIKRRGLTFYYFESTVYFRIRMWLIPLSIKWVFLNWSTNKCSDVVFINRASLKKKNLLSIRCWFFWRFSPDQISDPTLTLTKRREHCFSFTQTIHLVFFNTLSSSTNRIVNWLTKKSQCLIYNKQIEHLSKLLYFDSAFVPDSCALFLGKRSITQLSQ